MKRKRQEEKQIIWVGNSLEVLKSFPENAKINIGHDLRRLQEGKLPLDSRPMQSIAQGVYELRDRDGHGWYRAIYYAKVKGKIYVLHCFIKRSSKTPKKDLQTTILRLRSLMASFMKGKKK